MKRSFDNELLLAEVERLLQEGRQVTIPVRGRSMRPFLRDGKDSVSLRVPLPEEPKRGDVVLARTDGKTVLHRVIDRQGDRIILQGDGNAIQTEETSVRRVMGVAFAFMRKNKVYEATGRVWRGYSRWWMKLAPWRRLLSKLRGSLSYMRATVAGYKRTVSLSCLTGLLSVLLSLTFIYVSKLVIDVAAGETRDGVTGYALLLVLIVAAQLACDAADSWISVRMQLDVGNALRHRLFSRLLHSRWNELEQFHTGDVVNRVERDTSSVVSLLTVSFPAFTVTAVQLLAAFLLFCYLDPRLPWIVVAAFPFFLLGSRFYMRRMYRYTHKIRRSDSRIQSIIQESLQQRAVIKALEQDGRRVNLLDKHQGLLRTRFMKRTRFSILSRSCVSAAFAGGYLTAFLWGANSLSEGAITFGTMAAFLQLVGKVQRPLLDIARLIPSLVEAFTSVERLRELESVPTESEEKRLRFTECPDIEIDDLGFRYGQGDRPVFQHFSCRFPAGSRTAVTGETGRGKTTLIRLLLAFASPQEGSVRLRSPRLSASVSPETRCNFTYVPQGNTLFSGTIRDNLRMGNPNATEKEMRKALSCAEADFVFSLPDGMDTHLSEQGGGISEGQAQRIAIARALLRDSHILLLDEATSALDADTERRLVENLRREYAGKTFIFITHHSAVSEMCERVVSL